MGREKVKKVVKSAPTPQIISRNKSSDYLGAFD